MSMPHEKAVFAENNHPGGGFTGGGAFEMAFMFPGKGVGSIRHPDAKMVRDPALEAELLSPATAASFTM